MGGGTGSEKTENMEQFDVVHTIVTDSGLRLALCSSGPILGADETQYLICGRTPPSEQLGEHYGVIRRIVLQCIARLSETS